ncbi:MAG: response regulator [Chloroflexota bacterium]
MVQSILIVDDSPSATPELRALLEGEGYQVLTALRGEEALDILQTSKVDLIVSESLLPGMDGFDFVRRVREIPRFALLPIIMLTVRSTTEDYTAGFASGAHEYFVKPMEAPKILAAIRGLLARFELGKLENPMVASRSNDLAPTRNERGKIITVFSVKGGVGTTTIAVNIAVAIKQAAPSARVGLIDLSLEEGHCALLLDIVATSSIVEWASEDLSEATPYLLNQYFVQHRTGVSVMAAPALPEQAETIGASAVRVTLDLAPQVFDYIVVDTAASFSESSLIALEQASTILLPVTPDMSALKSAVNTLRILKAVNIGDDKVMVLLNEIVPRAGLTREQMESSLGRQSTPVPHAGPDFIEASNQGMPIVTVEPPSSAARSLIDIARGLCEPEGPYVPSQRVSVASVMTRLEERIQRFRRSPSS